MSKRVYVGLAALASCLIVLFGAPPADAQGNCPPGCECHRVDNQFIIECSGNATSVPPTAAPTDNPGNNQTPEPRDTPNLTPQPTSQATPGGGNYLTMYCHPLPAGSYGLNCPGNLYDVVYACGPGFSFCWFVSVNCAACVTPTAAPPGTVGELPCADVNFSQNSIQCTIGWDRRVSARVPPVPVTYSPYPRGVVYDPMQFTLPALIVQGWQCSSPLDGWDPIAWAPADGFRKLTFCLRWKQVKYPQPEQDPAPAWAEWYWDERAWGEPKSDLSRRREAQHAYVTSSAEKPTNGVDARPSYQVRVRTFWVVEWNETWERETTKCVYTGNPDDVCNGQPSARKETRWVPEGRDGTVDLRFYGSPHFYTDSTLVETPWGARLQVLPVPVIEVQGVIEKP